MFGRVKPIATTDEKNELDIPRVLFYFNSGALRDIYRAVALQHEPLRADAPFCEHVHPLRYYGSVQDTLPTNPLVSTTVKYPNALVSLDGIRIAFCLRDIN